MDTLSLIRLAAARHASDLHLAAHAPPTLRINGFLEPMEDISPLTADDVEECFRQLLPAEEQKKFHDTMELDFGFTVEDLVRIRSNVAMQRGTMSISMRLIPTVIPTLEQIHVPEVCRDLIMRPSGLVIVSGPTGSGKSTTLAAMINHLNITEKRRVVTIEDPIEYVYTNNKCTIIQRELGDDTVSYVSALKHVLRQDPDVILVGEIRDSETAAAVLQVAETGHLVLTTGHAPSSYQAVERVIDMFPPHERFLSQTRLASLLVGILCQKLVPTADGGSRWPAVEVMLANPAVRNLIREGKIHQLPNVIRTSSTDGMQLMDQALVNQYLGGIITGKSLLSLCNDRNEVERLAGDINMWKVTRPLPVRSGASTGPVSGDDGAAGGKI